jgi:hypothetical protein
MPEPPDRPRREPVPPRTVTQYEREQERARLAAHHRASLLERLHQLKDGLTHLTTATQLRHSEVDRRLRSVSLWQQTTLFVLALNLITVLFLVVRSMAGGR